MKNKKISFILANFLAFTISIPAISNLDLTMPEMPDLPEIQLFSSERKIVVFKESAAQKDRLEATQTLAAKIIKKWNLALKADLLENLTSKEEVQLLAHPAVLRIDPDIRVDALWHAWLNSRSSTVQTSQTLPWGIDKIDADLVWTSSSSPLTGANIKVGVIDTGIELAHPDLSTNIKGGYNAIRPTRSANDDNGHGTHVAGIIAALNNNYGVVGVGPQISLYSIKVLDSRGSGWLSDIIEGLDWAIANKMQVVNLSLGTTSNVQSFHDAIKRTYQAGITVVAAAGNNGGNVNYPAAYPETLAVSATDINNNIASWSSRGPEVDLAAPGVSIYSTYRRKSYTTLSGTSMAAPHVTGTVALILSVPQKCDTDNNGKCSPDEIFQRLSQTAEDLGQAGKDSFYGYGLVDAEKAVFSP